MDIDFIERIMNSAIMLKLLESDDFDAAATIT